MYVLITFAFTWMFLVKIGFFLRGTSWEDTDNAAYQYFKKRIKNPDGQIYTTTDDQNGESTASPNGPREPASSVCRPTKGTRAGNR